MKTMKIKKILVVGVAMIILLISLKPHKDPVVPVTKTETAPTMSYHTIYDMETKYVTVKNGDTFWSIAQDNKISGYSTNEFTNIIMSVNHMNNSGTLQVGQKILVPISE